MRLSEKEARDLAEKTGAELPVKKPRKYRNEPIVIDGLTFDSKLEATRYGVLLQRQAAGEIRMLVIHRTFELRGRNGAVVCKYECDFSYQEKQHPSSWWEKVVEDVKGVKTAEFRLKAKLFEDNYGIRIKIVTKENVYD